MARLKDITGQKFERLTVTKLIGKHPTGGNAIWECVCECGNITKVIGRSLRAGTVKSCGCFNREKLIQRSTTHGHTINGKESKTYRCWVSMMQRCYNPKDPAYCNYGARSIIVCERWHQFENFLADMGEAPKDLCLDRINNDGSYSPDNCRWVSYTVNNNNRRYNRHIEFNGKRATLSEWSRITGISVYNIHRRIFKYGWSIERTLTTPGRVAKTKETET